jgi:peptide/nickel transport system permease protein
MADVLTQVRPTAEGVRRRRQRMPVLVGISFVVATFTLVLVLFGQWLTPYDPTAQNLKLSAAGPGHGHWLGTDSLGRDVTSLIIAGARVAVLGPLIIALGTVLIGATLGIMAGFKGGLLDGVVNRFADLLYALPGLLVVIVIVGVVGGGYWLAVAVLIVLSVPAEIRLCRSATSVQVRMAYVEAARVLGLPARRIMVRHILPNILPTIIATVLLDFVGGLISLSSLSYLGLGVPPGTPDWGSLLQAGQSLLQVNPWMSVAAGAMIILTATSMTLIGDWLYDRYSQRGESR